jgi:hypothetical protein
MMALRQIQPIQGHSLTVELPPAFLGYPQAEIIVFPLGTATTPAAMTTELFIQRFAGALPDFPEIDPVGHSQEREGWE